MAESDALAAKREVLDLFRTGEFEKAIEAGERSGAEIQDLDIYSIMIHLLIHLEKALECDDFTVARQNRLRVQRLLALVEGEFDSNALIAPVVLPEDYSGKILLVSISGGIIGDLVCLRSDDLHHRDILNNTELEIRDLGLHKTRVRELGGAGISNEPDGRIRIWGGSDEFGPCDKNIVAALIKLVNPEKRIVIEE
ncbi:MAG: hypothetical protein AB9866_19390 [Syntrophobacteraceae bacterium]